MDPRTHRPRRDGTGRALLAIAAATAASASIAELAGLSEAAQDVTMLAGWRAFGLAVFAGVFALLAWRPRGYPGLFELAIGHKLALAVYALSHLDTATDAGTVAVADGLLAVTLVGAYILVGARHAWSPHRDRSTVPHEDGTPVDRVAP